MVAVSWVIVLVLAVDTATPAVTSGLVRLDTGAAQNLETVAVRVTDNPRAHAEILTPQILECLAEAGCEPADLDAIVVGGRSGTVHRIARRDGDGRRVR